MDYIHVKDTTIVLAVDARLEHARYQHCMVTLREFGTVKHEVAPFPYGQYVALDPMDRCYDNAMETVDRHGLKYVEGVLVYNTDRGPFPLSHGWCETQEGQIIDPTCHKQQGRVKVIYCGVPIRSAYSKEWYRRTGYYGCLDGDKEGRPWGPCYEHPKDWLDRG